MHTANTHTPINLQCLRRCCWCLLLLAAGTIALIAGGAFALSKLDDGFGEFMDSASCKVRLLLACTAALAVLLIR